jgi:hypothetical protein
VSTRENDSIKRSKQTNAGETAIDFDSVFLYHKHEESRKVTIQDLTKKGIKNIRQMVVPGEFESFTVQLPDDSEGLFCNTNCEQVDLSNITSMDNVVNMENMFKSSNKLSTVVIKNLNMENINSMEYMFADCRDLKTVVLLSGKKHQGNVTTNVHNMFYGVNRKLKLVTDCKRIQNEFDRYIDSINTNRSDKYLKAASF